jgi:hypothetical protein
MKYISVKFLEIEDKEFSPKLLQMIQIPLSKESLKIVIDWLNKEHKKVVNVSNSEENK